MKNERATWFKVSKRITASKDYRKLSSKAQHLFVTLCRLRNFYIGDKKIAVNNPDRTFYISNEELAEQCGFPESTMRRLRAELTEAKFVLINYNRRPPWYTILDDVYAKEMESHRDKDALQKPLEECWWK